MSTNVKNNNQVNDVIDNGLKFDISNSITYNPVTDTLSIVAISLRGGKTSKQIDEEDHGNGNKYYLSLLGHGICRLQDRAAGIWPV